MWNEEHFSAAMTMTSVADWCVSMSADGDWELFGGEMRLDAVSCDSDGVDLHADNSEEVGWQAGEDDNVSDCSSATSWSCLRGNSLLETHSEMYGNLCKAEDEEKFDRLIADELMAGIVSCMNDDLPVSLEQFYEIDDLIDASVDVECGDSDSADSFFGVDRIDGDAVVADDIESKEPECHTEDQLLSCEVGFILDHINAQLHAVNNAESETDAHTPDTAAASSDCEELYEELVAVEDTRSTISGEQLQDVMTGSCPPSVVEFEPSEDVEISCESCQSSPVEPTHSRRLRKKEQNKSAALRYRLKKRCQQGLVLSEYATLERRNIELKTRLDAMTKEISYLKSLINELCP